MKIRPILLMMILSASIPAIATSCSAPDPKEVEAETTAVAVEECKTPTLSQALAPAAASLQDDEDSYGNDQDEIFLLEETPGYNNSVKTIINGNCALSGCHVAGATSPDLTTFALLKDEMDASKNRMENAANPMPPGSQLAAEQLAIYAAWVAAGGPENDVKPTTTDPVTTPADPVDPVDPANTTEPATAPGCLVRNESRTELNEPDFEYLLKAAEAKACHDQGKIYDRNTKACGSANLDLSWCNRVGIIEKFSKLENKAGPVLDKALGAGTSETEIGDGFLIDQCGVEPNGAPVVIFIRLVKPPEVPGLKVRILALDPKKPAAKAAAPTE